MAGVRRGTFTCVGWQVTLCDPIWQVTSRSSEMGFPWRVVSAFTFFKFIQSQVARKPWGQLRCRDTLCYVTCVQVSRSSHECMTPLRTRWLLYASTTSMTRYVVRDRNISKMNSRECTKQDDSVAGRCRMTMWTNSSDSVHPRVYSHH